MKRQTIPAQSALQHSRKQTSNRASASSKSHLLVVDGVVCSTLGDAKYRVGSFLALHHQPHKLPNLNRPGPYSPRKSGSAASSASTSGSLGSSSTARNTVIKAANIGPSWKMRSTIAAYNIPRPILKKDRMMETRESRASTSCAAKRSAVSMPNV